MNSVERIKKLCKERKVSISRLERECGFANGYIGQLRKGSLPAERLKTVADYFGIPIDELLESEEGKQTAEEKQAELNAYLDELKNDPEQKILKVKNMLDRIRALCEAQNITVAQLEQNCGLGKNSIYRWETNKPSIDKVQRVAAALGTTVSDLIGEEESLASGDTELTKYLDELKNDPEQRMLFNLMKSATKDELRATVAFIRTLREKYSER